jgi:hypothetical protein
MPVDTAPAREVDEILEPEPSSLARRFVVPVTFEELASDIDAGLQMLERRNTLVTSARKWAIAQTWPEDYVVYQSVVGRITCYLSDAGGQRAAAIWGVNVINVSEPQIVGAPDGKHFAVIVRGDGYSRLSKQTVEGFIGARSSDEKFCEDKSGQQLEIAVKKAARANLDGGIARALMGLKSIPIAELAAAWVGSPKSIDNIPKGRGFGTQEERLGATREGTPDVTPPTCTVCKGPDGQPLPLLYRAGKGDKPAFYGCRNWEKHKQVKVIVKAADWVAQEQKRAQQNAADARAQAAEIEDAKRQDADLAKRERDPGAEG